MKKDQLITDTERSIYKLSEEDIAYIFKQKTAALREFKINKMLLNTGLFANDDENLSFYFLFHKKNKIEGYKFDFKLKDENFLLRTTIFSVFAEQICIKENLRERRKEIFERFYNYFLKYCDKNDILIILEN